MAEQAHRDDKHKEADPTKEPAKPPWTPPVDPPHPFEGPIIGVLVNLTDQMANLPRGARPSTIRVSIPQLSIPELDRISKGVESKRRVRVMHDATASEIVLQFNRDPSPSERGARRT